VRHSLKVRPWIVRALLVLGATLVAVTATEVVLRIHAHFENRGILTSSFDPGVAPPATDNAQLCHLIRLSSNPRIIYELKPNLSLQFRDALVNTNSMGFRSREVDDSGQGDSFRIVGIGDSSMFGYGVADHEPHLAVLERLLQERYPDLTIEVINTAVPGYNTVMEVETIKQKGLQLQPDLVIIEYVGNDLSLPTFVRKKREVLSLTESFFWSFVRHRLVLLEEKPQGARQRLESAGAVRIPMEDPESYGHAIDPELVPAEYRDMVGWAAYTSAMEELRDLSRSHGFQVMTLTLLPYGEERKQKALEISRQLGFHALDLGPRYREHLQREGREYRFRGSTLSVSKSDGHPSPLAHSMAAETVMEYLIQKGLVG
jgi:lysophospholipase L1-like esterase